MKVIIQDSGDMSVGIFPQQWIVDCPFEIDELNDHKDWFSQELANLYGEFANGKITIDFIPEEKPQPNNYTVTKEEMKRWSRNA